MMTNAEIVARIDALRPGEMLNLAAPLKLRAVDGRAQDIDPATEIALPVMRVLRFGRQREYEIDLPGGRKYCDHAETLVEVQRFLSPPRYAERPKTDAELARLAGYFALSLEPMTMDRAFLEAFGSPVGPQPKTESGRAILAQINATTRQHEGEAHRLRERREFERRTAWAIDVATEVWPKPIWEITISVNGNAFVHVPSLRWSVYQDEPMKLIASEEIPLFPTSSRRKLASMVASVRDQFFDNFKAATRETKFKTPSHSWVSLADGIRLTGGMVARPAPDTPGERIARAFALPLPGDADEMHDRLFVGPRAGMEDIRNGR